MIRRKRYYCKFIFMSKTGEFGCTFSYANTTKQFNKKFINFLENDLLSKNPQYETIHLESKIDL